MRQMGQARQSVTNLKPVLSHDSLGLESFPRGLPGHRCLASVALTVFVELLSLVQLSDGLHPRETLSS